MGSFFSLHDESFWMQSISEAPEPSVWSNVRHSPLAMHNRLLLHRPGDQVYFSHTSGLRQGGTGLVISESSEVSLLVGFEETVGRLYSAVLLRAPESAPHRYGRELEEVTLNQPGNRAPASPTSPGTAGARSPDASRLRDSAPLEMERLNYEKGLQEAGWPCLLIYTVKEGVLLFFCQDVAECEEIVCDSVSLSSEASQSHVQPQVQQRPAESADFAQHISQEIAGQVARNAAQQGLGLFRKGAGEIRVYIERNHYSVHALSLCGGGFLALVSALGLMNIFGALSGPLSYLLQSYQLFFGLVLCIIDGPGEKLPRAQAAIVQYAPFLYNNAGRSAFYLFVACLEGSQSSWIHDIVGWYFLGISVMHVALKFKSLGSPTSELDDKAEELLPQAASSP